MHGRPKDTSNNKNKSPEITLLIFMHFDVIISHSEMKGKKKEKLTI